MQETLSILSEVKEMAKGIVSTDEAPKARWYSQAVKAGGFIFVSGQAPLDARTGELIGTTIQEQTAQSLKNIDAILEAAGSALDKAVSATFILADESDFSEMNEEWESWTKMRFPESGSYVVPGALEPISINCERDEGIYIEPNVWVRHSL
jgi:2-iminobutanoate/2-iminopropanoate deaminase